VSTNRVPTSTVYLQSEGATSVLVAISFLLKGCDIVIIMSVSYCPSSRSMRWLPLSCFASKYYYNLLPCSHLAHYVHQHMCLLTSVTP